MKVKRLPDGRLANWALFPFSPRFEIPAYDFDPLSANPARWTETHMVRYRLLATPLFGVYLHKFSTPDDRDTLHDHPWSFTSFILRGGYDEMVWREPGLRALRPYDYARTRSVRRFNHKRSTDFHYISALHRSPTWTLIFVGRRKRTWGWLDSDGTWTPFDQHRHSAEYHAATKRLRDFREQAQQNPAPG